MKKLGSCNVLLEDSTLARCLLLINDNYLILITTVNRADNHMPT